MTDVLVSVFICTYNSSNTIIETLESIKSQTYRNIELIISDDDSKDDTVSICKNWLSENKDCFKRAKIITHSSNTGTSGNANRAISACKGEWVKGIGADDKLLPNCIEDFVKYINEHLNATIVFSKVVGFGNMEAARKWPWINVKKFFDALTPKQFRIILSTQNFLPAASVFYRKTIWENVGGYDESIPLLEDWPFWVKTLAYGYNFDFLDKETVEYRFSEFSISHGKKSKLFEECEYNASLFAKKALKDFGLLYAFLYQTICMQEKYSIPKLIFLLNIWNPAYYEYRKSLRLFNKLCQCQT